MPRVLMMLALWALAAGCGGGESMDGGAPSAEDDGGYGEEEAAPSGGGGDYTPGQGTATVTGTVTYDGKPPRRRPLDLGTEAYCTQTYADKPLLSEIYVVGPDGGLANVWVSVTKGLAGWKFPKGQGEVVLNQKGCQYVPHVVAAQVGQTLVVQNNDPIMHNVHGINMKTKKDEFNWAQARAGIEHRKKLRRAAQVFVKCDVHAWMGSYLMVVKHPFFAVTGEDGTFRLDKLPPGTYTVRAWHEKLDSSEQTVTVGDGESKAISFSFQK